MEGQALEVSFDGQDGVDWYAVLVRGQENILTEYVSIELDENGVGTGQINFPGDGDDVFLVVSPKDPAAVGIHYNWSRADELSMSGPPRSSRPSRSRRRTTPAAATARV